MNEPFKTSDQGLAAYLLYRGVDLVGCIPSGQEGRLFFVFQDATDRDQYVEEWMTRSGDAKELARFYSKVKQTRRELRNPVAG